MNILVFYSIWYKNKIIVFISQNFLCGFFEKLNKICFKFLAFFIIVEYVFILRYAVFCLRYKFIMDKLKINITADDPSLVPVYQTEGSGGADLKAAESGVIESGDYRLIKTGIRIELPSGYEAQVRPRSGLALKHGVTSLNSPGTIDCDYRGEIGVILINHGKEPFRFQKGDRIAQLVISRYAKADFNIVGELSGTERGTGGFGHTGK